MRGIRNLFLTLLAAVLGGCGSIPFHPSATIEHSPDEAGLAYEDVRINTSDGETLAGWFLPAPAGEGGQGKALLFFHGNAGNISHRLESLAIFHGLGFAQLIIDYRGFGESSGKPSVSGTVLDAEAAWSWLLREKGYRPGQVVVFGRSLGGGVAAALAAKVEPGALILESTFTSLYDVGKNMYPMLPVSWVITEDYDTPGNLAHIRVPLLVVHSPDDELITFDMGKALFDGYAGPKRFLEIRGSHNTGYSESKELYIEGLRAFLQSLP